MKTLSETTRLDLIVEAVKYCQKMSLLGMPKACYTKALREPVFFLWEAYGKTKVQAARYCSESCLATGVDASVRVYDHAIPFRFVEASLLGIDNPNPDSVRIILESKLITCLITRDEDKRLTSLGLSSKMPGDADESNYLARYESAGIKVVPNPYYSA